MKRALSVEKALSTASARSYHTPLTRTLMSSVCSVSWRSSAVEQRSLNGVKKTSASEDWHEAAAAPPRVPSPSASDALLVLTAGGSSTLGGARQRARALSVSTQASMSTIEMRRMRCSTAA